VKPTQKWTSVGPQNFLGPTPRLDPEEKGIHGSWRLHHHPLEGDGHF
jgi:hypothetical protein